MYSLVFLTLAAFALCWFLTPACRGLFLRLGIVDRPDRVRKLHSQAIPRAGGIAIATAYLGAYVFLLVSPLTAKALLADNLPFVWSLLPALAVAFATGLADDLIGLRPWEKLAGQVAAASLAYWAGVRILAIGRYSTELWWWSFPLTVFWLVGCTNAFNLIDGVDGLAAGIGLFSSVAFFIGGLMDGNLTLAVATLPLAACLLAFLRYNFPPASIFLGDSGSLFIGFLLGSYAVIWTQKSTAALALAAPLMALAIPLLDAALAIARRFLRSDSIFGADRGHIHHRLLDFGFTPREVTLTLYGICSLFGSLALLASVLHNRYRAAVVTAFSVIAWFLISRLRYVEFGVARGMLSSGVIRHLLRRQIGLARLESRLLGAATAEESWLAIRDAAHEFGFCYLRLRLGDEAFEEALRDHAGGDVWQLQVPLNGSGQLTLKREFDVPGPTIAIGMFIDLLYRSLNRNPAGIERSLVNLHAHVGCIKVRPRSPQPTL